MHLDLADQFHWAMMNLESSRTCQEVGLTFHVNEETIRLHMGSTWLEIREQIAAIDNLLISSYSAKNGAILW